MRCSDYVYDKKMHIEFLLGGRSEGSLKERDSLKDTVVDGNIISTQILK
jgi:hypothetical protein